MLDKPINWASLTVGKHAGKTLPQVIFADAEYFFWAVESGFFEGKSADLRGQANLLAGRARRVKIPANRAGHLAEYFIDPLTRRFSYLQLVPAKWPDHEGGSPSIRLPFIDLSFACQRASYDKSGSKELVDCAKGYLFGSTKVRMTKVRCEIFFSDPANFVNSAEE